MRYIGMYVCICVYVCMYVRMCVCMYCTYPLYKDQELISLGVVSTPPIMTVYVRMYVCMYVCEKEREYACEKETE